ncbi:MAG: hypothetical protein AAF676_05755, partial [Pseudomonadota bacterium]
MDDGLDPLRRELDAWAEAGREAVLWWRDDDAGELGDPERRMLDLAARQEACVFIATPSIRTEPRFVHAVLEAGAAARILQHGYSHADFSPASEAGGWELGLHRPLDEILAQQAEGKGRLEAAFGGAFRPIMAPPWNRIAPQVAQALPALGFTGLSGMEGRTPLVPGLTPLMGHSDPVAWSRGRAFRGPAKVAAELSSALAARRLGKAQGPVGFVTHVWVDDDGCWRLTEALLRLVAGHPAARWLSA